MFLVNPVQLADRSKQKVKSTCQIHFSISINSLHREKQSRLTAEPRSWLGGPVCGLELASKLILPICRWADSSDVTAENLSLISVDFCPLSYSLILSLWSGSSEQRFPKGSATVNMYCIFSVSNPFLPKGSGGWLHVALFIWNCVLKVVLLNYNFLNVSVRAEV